MAVKPRVAVGQSHVYVAIDFDIHKNASIKIHPQQGYGRISYLEGSIPKTAATGLIITRKPPDTRYTCVPRA